MEKIDYALAPQGATHEYNGMWRLVEGDNCLHWSGLQWVYNPPLRVDDYEPIPEREKALNRLADKCTLWTIPSSACATVSTEGRFDWMWPEDAAECYFTKHEWQNRRAERIEAGLIKENNDLTDATVINYDTKPKAATESQQAKIDDLYTQLEQAQADRKHYGVHLAAALKGDKLPSEPVDQRLDKVRELVTRNIELERVLLGIVELDEDDIQTTSASAEAAFAWARNALGIDQ